MTAEQLEELAGGVNPLFMDLDFEQTITSLAHRVIAAEKLVEALDYIVLKTHETDCFSVAAKAITAYREASK